MVHDHQPRLYVELVSPRGCEGDLIHERGGLIKFSAHIGRVGTAQHLAAADIVFQDKLQ